jgi:hypothetical protein
MPNLAVKSSRGNPGSRGENGSHYDGFTDGRVRAHHSLSEVFSSAERLAAMLTGCRAPAFDETCPSCTSRAGALRPDDGPYRRKSRRCNRSIRGSLFYCELPGVPQRRVYRIALESHPSFCRPFCGDGPEIFTGLLVQNAAKSVAKMSSERPASILSHSQSHAVGHHDL